jgi:PPOX class probable F420-dependent enzyme
MSHHDAASTATSRPGYDPSAAATARRVLPMLEEERVVWLSTVDEDGYPHLVPTWFLWDGEDLLLWSKPGAVKVRNLRANPRLMVAIGHPDEDFAVGLIEAVAALDDVPVPDAFFAKYAADLGDAALDPAAYRALYTQAVRVTPTRFLPWHGRSARHDVADGRTAATHRGSFAPVADWVAGRLDAASARLRGASIGRGRSLPVGAL